MLATKILARLHVSAERSKYLGGLSFASEIS